MVLVFFNAKQKMRILKRLQRKTINGWLTTAKKKIYLERFLFLYSYTNVGGTKVEIMHLVSKIIVFVIESFPRCHISW